MIIGLHDSKKTPLLITPFTAGHFLFGIIANIVSKKLNLSFACGFTSWFLIHLLYECKDYYYSYLKTCNSYGCENSFINSVGDQIFAMLGFIVGQYASKQTLIPLFIITFVLIIIGFACKIG